MSAQEIEHIAVYPGSFDPITIGHVAIVRRVSRMFGRVFVAVAEHAQKEHTFPVEDRVEMTAEACKELSNVMVESFGGLVVEYARERGAQTMVKGLRAVSDFEREMQMAMMNSELAPDIDTMYLIAEPEHTFLSSSLVKHVHELGGDISKFVTPHTMAMLDAKLKH